MNTVNAAINAKVKAAVAKVLAQQFGAELVFNPIVVVPTDDGDGEVYLHVYIVFDDRDSTKIDTLKTYRFLGHLAAELGEGFTPEVLTKGFIPKSEWPQLARSNNLVPR